jgi:hypothetical protein
MNGLNLICLNVEDVPPVEEGKFELIQESEEFQILGGNYE